MMMAFDSSQPPPNRLDDESIAALRLALRNYLSDGTRAAPLRTALLTVARESRARSILAEQLLVTLKDVWSALPEVRAMHDSREQTALLQRVVTMCIKEYYS